MQVLGKKFIQGTNGLLVEVDTLSEICPICGNDISNVQKTVKHDIVTLVHGKCKVNETVLYCGNECINPDGSIVIKRSEHLRSLVQRKGTYGYDIEVYVGLQRYLHFCQITEIQSLLQEDYGITISTGEISVLSKRFLKHLSLLHKEKAGVIRSIMAEDGGYPLHIDATVEKGKGTLLVAYAGWRKWVLGAWKISSERSEYIEPCLEQTEKLFGTPCSIVRDLGRGMTLATSNFVKERDLEIPILACHLHFLRDIGKDMLNKSYDKLRKLFSTTSIRSNLKTFANKLYRGKGMEVDISKWVLENNQNLPEGKLGKKVIFSFCHWILDYQKESLSGNFPFEIPYLEFYNRCLIMNTVVDDYLRKKVKDEKNMKLLQNLSNILEPIRSNPEFNQVAHILTKQASLFNDLRNTLRLESEINFDNDSTETIESLNEIKALFDKYVNSLSKLRKKVDPSLKCSIDIISNHLNRHGKFLWGHAIKLTNQREVKIRLVERTNNLLESFFHKLKHDERRRSGRKILTWDLELLPASATLVANLKKDDYVKEICGSLDNLPKIFSQLDASIDYKINEIDNADDPLETNEPKIRKKQISSKDLKIIRSKEFLQLIKAIYENNKCDKAG